MATTTRASRGRRTPPADADERPVIGLPTFSPPIGTGEPPTAVDPAAEEMTRGETIPNSPPVGVGSLIGSAGNGHPGASPTRTGTYSDDDRLTGPTRVDKAETARNAGVLLAGLLTVVAGFSAVALARVGRELRRPSKDETRAVARPIARILIRHLPADMITADLADLGEAGAAVSDYVTAGPVAPRVVPVQHIGMVPPPAPDEHPDPGGPVDEVGVRTPGEAWHAAQTQFDQYPSALVDEGPKPKVEYLQ